VLDAATTALSVLSVDDQVCTCLVALGIIPLLIHRLRSSSSDPELIAAVAVLDSISVASPNDFEAIIAAGGVPVLVHCLRRHGSTSGSGGSRNDGTSTNNTSSDAVNAAAAQASSHLANRPSGMAAVLAAGSIPALVQCLGSCNSDSLQLEAVKALSNVTFCSPAAGVALAEAGGIPALVRCLHSSCEDMQKFAAVACINTAACGARVQEAIVAAGAVPRLVQLLQSGSQEPAEAAAAALSNLATYSSSTKEAIMAAGASQRWCSCCCGAASASRHSTWQFLRCAT